jgi:predicted site-specific integrase-resolvase
MKIERANGFCTYAWAAERLGVSVQQVGRYVKSGNLTAHVPSCGRTESTRIWLAKADVVALREARKLVGRG